MPTTLLRESARSAHLRLTLLDLEDVPSVVLTEDDRVCRECGDTLCDGEAHWEDGTEDYICEDCGHNDCICPW